MFAIKKIKLDEWKLETELIGLIFSKQIRKLPIDDKILKARLGGEKWRLWKRIYT